MKRMGNSTGRPGAGVMVLLVSNIIVKVIGMMFKIPLVNIIGDEGMGYFNSAYTIYTLFYTLSTAGLPVAVSMMISECTAKNNTGEKNGVYGVTIGFFMAIGILFSALMFFTKKPLAEFIGSEKAYLCIGAMSAVVLFVCLSSGVRGYFQGQQIMVPTAVSSVVEAVGKLVLGISLAIYGVARGYEPYKTAALAVIGITVSSLASTVYLLAVKKRFDRTSTRSNNINAHFVRKTVKRLIKYALPITMGSAVMSLTGVLDLALVMRRLISIGYSSRAATAMYGNYSGLAVPVFNVPSAIIAPISLSVVPLICSARAGGELKRAEESANSALRVGLLLSFPMAMGIAFMSEPILKLIFNSRSVGMAAPNLVLLAPAVVGVAVTVVSTAILQSYKKGALPVLSMAFGSLLKLISGYILIGRFGMAGAPCSTVICYTVTSAINLYFIKNHLGLKITPGLSSVKPCISAFFSCGCGYFVNSFINRVYDGRFLCIIGILTACLLYFALIFILGGINESDIILLPMGDFINRTFLKGRIKKGLSGRSGFQKQ